MSEFARDCIYSDKTDAYNVWLDVLYLPRVSCFFVAALQVEILCKTMQSRASCAYGGNFLSPGDGALSRTKYCPRLISGCRWMGS